MKANDVFKITLPNGVEVECVAITEMQHEHFSIFGGYDDQSTWLCYAQNRLFRVIERHIKHFNGAESYAVEYIGIIVDCCNIPLYDGYLQFHDHLKTLPTFQDFIKTRVGLLYLYKVADVLSDELAAIPGTLPVELVLSHAEEWYHSYLISGLLNADGPLE